MASVGGANGTSKLGDYFYHSISIVALSCSILFVFGPTFPDIFII